MVGYIKFYKVLLHLYPVDYRHEYETEMVQVFSELLEETTSSSQRAALMLTTTVETLKWATPELTAQAEGSVADTPTFIKMNTFLSVLCLLPFVLASLYRLHVLYDHDDKPTLLHLLIHTQFLYALILPTLGLIIAFSTIVWSLMHSKRYWHISWLVRLQTAWRNSILIFGFVCALSLVILS